MTWQMSPNGSHLQYFRYDPYTYRYIFCIQSSKQESIKKKGILSTSGTVCKVNQNCKSYIRNVHGKRKICNYTVDETNRNNHTMAF